MTGPNMTGRSVTDRSAAAPNVTGPDVTGPDVTGPIGYLTKRFPRLSETFILDEIIGLESAGLRLRLYSIGHPGELLVQPDVALVRSPVTYLHPPGGRAARLQGSASTFGSHVRVARRAPRQYVRVVGYIVRKRRHMSTLRHFAEAGRLADLLQRDGVRHLHAAFAHSPASVAHFVHLITGIPYSFAGHAKDIYVSAPDLLARKVAAAAFVLACSESAAGELRSLAGPVADKVVLARHGVNTARFSPAECEAPADRPSWADPSAPLRVLAVGRLVPKKGYPVLLAALAHLAEEGRPVSCRIIGSGADRAELEALARDLGVSEMVDFAGERTHQEIAAEYRRADVFVQASVVVAGGDRDGTPNSLLEAMASGIAVIASAVAGIPEAVAQGCGILVEPGDPGALASALGRIADEPALRDRLGRAARLHVAVAFDRADCARAIVPLFAPRAESPAARVAVPSGWNRRRVTVR